MTQKKLVFIIAGTLILSSMTYYSYFFQKKDNVLTDREMAEKRAYQWAHWLKENKYEIKHYKQSNENSPNQTEKNMQRGLASAELTVESVKMLDGEIGRDPWGKPFYYHVEGDGGHGSQVYIWSFGENGQPEYSSKEDLFANGTAGDDILIKMKIP